MEEPSWRTFPAVSWLKGCGVFAMLFLLQLVLGEIAPIRGKPTISSSLVLFAILVHMQKSISTV